MSTENHLSCELPAPIFHLKRCLYCGRGFTKTEHLKRHQRAHTGEKPFQCQYCRRSYARSDVLRRHIRNHHSGDDQKSVEPVTIKSRLRKPPMSVARNRHSRECERPRSSCLTPTTSPEPEDETADTAAVMPPSSSDPGESSMEESVTETQDRGHRENHDSIDIMDLDPLINESHLPTNAEFSSLALLAPRSEGQFPDVLKSYPDCHLGRNDNTGQNTQLDVETLNVSIPSNKQAEGNISESSPHGVGTADDDAIWISGAITTSAPADYASLVNLPYLSLDAWDEMREDLMSNTIDSSLHSVPAPAPARSYRQSPLPFPEEDEISTKQLARIENVWLSLKKPSVVISKLWKDVASGVENLLDDPVLANAHVTSNDCVNKPFNSRFSDTSRSRLSYLCRGNSHCDENSPLQMLEQVSPAFRNGNEFLDELGMGPYSSDLPDSSFPSSRFLETSLHLYFKRFHPMMPCVHRPTFCVPLAHSSVILPMCLIGMTFLDDTAARKFISQQIPVVISKCRSELSSRCLERRNNSELLATFTSAILILCLTTMVSEVTNKEPTQMLYIETLTLAEQCGLFRACNMEDIISLSLSHHDDHCAKWKAWSRVETTKRLIVCLIMIDAFYAHLYGSAPIIRLDMMCFNVPCHPKLFEASSWSQWKAMTAGEGMSLVTPCINLGKSSAMLPKSIDNFGMQGLLAAIWARVIDAQWRLFGDELVPGTQLSTPPVVEFAKDYQGKNIAPLLVQMQNVYGNFFATENPNSVVFWNNICLESVSSHRLFEAAAGCYGAANARSAVKAIQAWSKGPSARRACLHAAEIYRVLSRRRISDGTMFQSERALFSAALVLGLYLYVQPERKNSHADQADPDVFELLDPVDWAAVGSTGLSTTSSSDVDDGQGCCPAKRFILEDGKISFAGNLLSGGLKSMRYVLLDYLGVLEEVGRWHSRTYSHILLLMSDSTLEEDMRAE